MHIIQVVGKKENRSGNEATNNPTVIRNNRNPLDDKN